MTIADTPLARRIPLAGPCNLRDLGGYATGNGGTVQWRSVFRSDGLDNMTAEDVDVVVDELGVGVVIDLRTEKEIEFIGVGPIRDTDIRWHNVSIIDETHSAWQHALAKGTIVDQYFAMLDGSGPKFVEAIELVATADVPLLFHCAAGKDRTGLIAGFVLSMLGVSDEDLAADYALTTEVLPVLEQRYRERINNPKYLEQFGHDAEREEKAARGMSSDAATLRTVFAGLRASHGSPEAWLTAHGLDRGAADRLRHRLLA